jgi:hypothetical protein
MTNPLDGSIMLTAAMKAYKYVVLDVYRGSTGDIEDIDVSNVDIKFVSFNHSLNSLYENHEQDVSIITDGEADAWNESLMRKGYYVQSLPNNKGDIRQNNNFAITDYIPLLGIVDEIRYSGIIASAAIAALFTNSQNDSKQGMRVLMDDPLDGKIILTDELKAYKYVVLDVYRGSTGDIADIDVSNVDIKFISYHSLDNLYNEINMSSSYLDTLRRFPSLMPPKKSMVMFSYDAANATDGRTTNDAILFAKKLGTYGFSATFHVVPQLLSTLSDLINIKTLMGMGQNISVHGDYTVIPVDSTSTLTDGEFKEWMISNYAAFVQKGIYPIGFVTPNGELKSGFVPIVQKLYGWAATTENIPSSSPSFLDGVNDRQNTRYDFYRVNIELTPALHTQENVTALVNKVKAAIDACIENDGYLVLYGHYYENTNSNYAIWDDVLEPICAYIKQKVDSYDMICGGMDDLLNIYY